ncbi:hypothetical protein, partial [Klebsiella pneumoniae]|uniref:hypothetical protein n=1 Tax=Klebsiella pneumoniae TaxID=573 RepID=UPI0019D15D4F
VLSEVLSEQLAVGGFITKATRKIVIGSGRQSSSERGANQRAGEPDGDGGTGGKYQKAARR